MDVKNVDQRGEDGQQVAILGTMQHIQAMYHFLHFQNFNNIM